MEKRTRPKKRTNKRKKSEKVLVEKPRSDIVGVCALGFAIRSLIGGIR